MARRAARALALVLLLHAAARAGGTYRRVVGWGHDRFSQIGSGGHATELGKAPASFNCTPALVDALGWTVLQPLGGAHACGRCAAVLQRNTHAARSTVARRRRGGCTSLSRGRRAQARHCSACTRGWTTPWR
jgi:hypothetical protein